MRIIEVNQLTRKFDTTYAVNGISFSIDKGEVFGFLGPNGAGKTTTIRMLTGQLRPTSGSALLNGVEVWTDPIELRKQIGIVFEYQNLYERMTGLENLEFTAELYRVKKSRVNDVLDRVHLQQKAKQKVSHYSNGMKQRLLIARAVLHEPSILFLDEPTRGLDPLIAREIRSLIMEIAQQGTTIFLTTHYMEEADQMCDRVAIIDQGKIVALDRPIALKEAHGKRQLTLVTDAGKTISLDIKDPEDSKRLGIMALEGSIRFINSTLPSLEDVFIQLTGKELA